MSFETIKQRENEYVMHTYGRVEIALEKGNGCIVTDSEGKEYIDLTSGIGVNCLGHNHPALIKAINDQAAKMIHCSNIYYSEPMTEVARQLVKASGLNKVFFANSGAEANEGMIKVACKYSSDKYGKNRYKILTLVQSFHGRTMVTLKATGQPRFHQYFYPFPEGFDYVEANNYEDFISHVDDEVCAVMMEMVQGEGGVLPLDKEYVKKVTDYCHANDILVLVDEVQTGIGRTGTLFSYEQFDILPDIISLAKGLGGGLPIGAVVAGDKCKDVLVLGTHGSTFGGNLLSSAAANAVLSVVNQKDFLTDVQNKGNTFMRKIKELHSKNIYDVRGMGLMIGIIVDPNKRAGYVDALKDKGVLVLTAGSDAIRLLPPLVLTYAEIDQVVDIMKGVFE